MKFPEHCLVARVIAAVEHAPIGPAVLTNLTAERLAELIIQGIDRHGLRGLIYEANGLTDVVIHGKVDMLAVATAVLEATRGGEHESGLPG